MAIARSDERCTICGCALHRRRGTYARPTLDGRSHATTHHLVAERFFGRSGNRPGTRTAGLFDTCPWGFEGQTALLCYECHEELVHNPVLLPDDLAKLRTLIELRGLGEDAKGEKRDAIAGRVRLFHEVIARGLDELLRDARGK